MYSYLKLWLSLRIDRRAVTALEYGLIAALIAGVIVTSVALLGTNINSMFSRLAAAISSGNTGVQTP
jgi:pilus assembly protein Flp/PilA